MSIQHATDQSFDQTVQGNDVVVVDFWAPWCGPCKTIAPVLEELAGQVPDNVTIAKLNVDDNPETAGKYGIMSIPTLLVFKNGEPVDKTVGVRNLNDLKNWVEKYQQG